ncbi:MAG: MlaD family protein [Gemmatimonadetes bacterium]|nr:MlaD family protein [Gemmatimonadota bacterium]
MRGRNEVAVGATVILGLAVIVFGTIWLQGRGFGREEMVLQARFSEIGQLLQGNAVKVHGVPIGRVESIDLDPGGSGVIITMRVQSDVRLPEDPVVVLSPESMFGDWQAEISPRSAASDFDYAESPDPAVLPGASLPDISRLTAVADRIAQNMAILSERFEVAFTQETAENVRRAINNIQSISQQLTELVTKQQEAIDEVSANLQETTDALGQAVETVNRTFGEVERAIGGDRLANIVANAERASTQIDSLTRELLAMSSTLRTASATADTTLRALGSVTRSIERGEGSLGLMLRDSSLYWRLVESNAEIQALLKDIRQNPRKYFTIRVF